VIAPRSGAVYVPSIESRRPAPPTAGRRFFTPQTRQDGMIEALKQKLTDEAEKLRFELNVTLPNEIRKAVELGDLRENSEYKAALERQQFVQARLGQLTQRLSRLSSIDESQIAVDAVGMGSKVVVEDEGSGERETYHLIFGDAEEFEEGQVTMSSPIGRALLGKKVGELALLKLPARTRKLRVVQLVTIHEGD
jgi:transcription elongation factor GreA